MNSSGTYRVTRSGRDVFVGAADGLMREAREGRILANDLIYDPTLEKWVFARSLSLLAGFTLKGRRQVGVDTEDVVETQVLSESLLHKKNRRRTVMLRGAGAMLMFVSTALLIYLVPDTAPSEEKSLTRFAEDTPSIRYEGSGPGVDTKGEDRAGPSNLDSKAVEIEATQGDPGRSGRFGRKAQLENPGAAQVDGPAGQVEAAADQAATGSGEGGQPDTASQGGGNAPPAEAPNGGSSAAEQQANPGSGQDPGTPGAQERSTSAAVAGVGSGAGADGPPDGADGKLSEGDQTGGAQEKGAQASNSPPVANATSKSVSRTEGRRQQGGRLRPLPTPRVYDRPEPNAKPPARLPLASSRTDEPTVTLKASRNESRIVRARQLSEAMRALARAESTQEQVAPSELLTARYQAQMARNSLAIEDREHPDLGMAETLIEKLSKAFMELCTSIHSDAFCVLKEKEPDWPDVVVRNVIQEQALVGMSKDQLGAAWGLPSDIRKERRGRLYCYTDDCARFARVMGDVVVEVSQ